LRCDCCSNMLFKSQSATTEGIALAGVCAAHGVGACVLEMAQYRLHVGAR
jgi:hypothetical protein